MSYKDIQPSAVDGITKFGYTAVRCHSYYIRDPSQCKVTVSFFELSVRKPDYDVMLCQQKSVEGPFCGNVSLVAALLPPILVTQSVNFVTVLPILIATLTFIAQSQMKDACLTYCSKVKNRILPFNQ